MSTPASKPNSSRPPTRPPVTLAAAAALCPSEQQADSIADAFGLDQVATAEIRLRTRAHLIEMATMLQDHVHAKALALHLQRVVAGFVGSAFQAGKFYDSKMRQARAINSKLYNEDRDEDRHGPAGFDSRAQRAREFAAELALQAHAILAAAEGAVEAFEHLTGDVWRPWTPAPHPGHSLARQVAEAQFAAFSR